MDNFKYEMRINLNVLNHLGLNLYSNIPAVLSEVVANSWDADATNVDIKIEKGKISITDDGHGMTEVDVNNKYLWVGYERRKNKQLAITEKYKREVMGRKGIGKLSLFSIAETVEVHTFRAGEKNGFVMSVEKIKAEIEQEGSTYYPDPLDESEVDLKRDGTRIILTGLKKGVNQAPNALRKRLARRFSIIGNGNFNVKINGEAVTVTDRDYFRKLQYLWHFGDRSESYIELCKRFKLHKLEHEEKRKGEIKVIDESDVQDKTYSVKGWIGTVLAPADLIDNEAGDNLNKIVIMVRGKLAQENILEDFAEGRLYTKYLIGEIHADFLDLDDADDIATSSRQEIIKDDPRYQALHVWIEKELKNIRYQWTDLRNEKGEEDARQIPAIAKWLDGLRGDRKRHAKALLGKIGQLALDEDKRVELYQYSVLAFESLMYKDRLSALQNITPENIHEFVEIFADLAEIEASHYYQIVNERLQIIETLDEMVDTNVVEEMIRDYLYEHLWLFDPSWERATDALYMEQKVKTAFDKINNKLLKSESGRKEHNGRVDIRYKKVSGQHVIIELKRPNRKMSDSVLMEQVDKYRTALRELLDESGSRNEPIEIVCIVGKKLKQWKNPAEQDMSEKMLAAKNTRVVLYRKLIKDSRRSYQAFLEKKEDAGRVCELIRSIETDVLKGV